jgi:hypothetical protein
MTKKEEERLAIVETKVDRINSDITEIKSSVKNIETILNAQDEKFLSKNTIKTYITVAVSVIIAVVAVANYLTHNK